MKRFTLLVIIICLFAAGCQPTPEQQIVVQKNTERMIETAIHANNQASGTAMDAHTLRGMYEIPEAYQAELAGADGNLTISIDAQISIPENGILPIVRVEAANFQQEFIDSFVDIVFGDRPIYHPPEEFSKSRIEKIIFDTQTELMQDNLHPDTRASLEERILQWQEKLLVAEEDIAPLPATTMLQDRSLNITSEPNGAGMILSVHNDEDEGDLQRQEVIQQESGVAYDVYTRQAVFEYQRDENVAKKLPQIIRGASLVADVTNHAATGSNVTGNILQVSPQEARTQAEQFLGMLNLKEIAVNKIWLVSNYLSKDILELMVSRGSIASLNDYYSQTAQIQAYEIHCSRTVQGVNVTSDTFFNSRSSSNDDFYSKEWFYEEILLYVDDQGVAMFSWSAPLAIIELITQEATILPFPTIQEIFEKMMMVKHEPQYKGSEAGASTFEVKKVVLSLQRISEQNSVSQGLLIPTWNFYGNQANFHLDGAVVTNDVYGLVPLMTINAIDGSIIDPWNGY